MPPHLVDSFWQAAAAPELKYSALVFSLFILPRFFVRYGVPYALSAYGMGFLFTAGGIDLSGNEVVQLLSFFGIVALFLFAGLEVDLQELRQNRAVLMQHVLVSFGLLVVAGFGLQAVLGLDRRPAVLMGLAVLTPSAGFILDSLESARVPEASKYWIRAKVIAAEIVALALMFVLIRSMSALDFVISSAALAALILLLPLAFRFFAKTLDPVAPKSEFGFLLIVALLAGMLTKKLGAYYLVGAFVVGLVARRFEATLPRFSSKSMLSSLRIFATFFTPFYFFSAGAGVRLADLNFRGLLIGLGLLVVFVPARIYAVAWHRRISLGEGLAQSLPVAASLLPNLVFGLVLADILKESFRAPPEVFAAVVVYTVGATLIPGILLRHFWKSSDYAALTQGEPAGEVPWGGEPTRRP